MKRVLASLIVVVMACSQVFTTDALVKKNNIVSGNSGLATLITNPAAELSAPAVGLTNPVNELAEPTTELTKPAVELSTGLKDGRTSEESLFCDISGHWAEKQITALANKGIIKGVMLDKNKFSANPDKMVTLAEYINLVIKVAGLEVNTEMDFEKVNTFNKSEKVDSYKDSEKPWYQNSMDVAIDNGFLKGLPVDVNKADMPLSRAVIADITAKVYGWNSGDLAGVTVGYLDVSENDWFYKSAIICKLKKIMRGYEDNTFRPMEIVTRAQALTLIYNCMEIAQKEQNSIPNNKAFNSFGVPVSKNQILSFEKNLSVIADIYHLKNDTQTSIFITNPILNSNFPITVKAVRLDLEGYTKGKKIDKIYCSVINNNGSGELLEYITRVPAVVTSVYEEKGNIYTKWSFAGIRIRNNANTVRITSIDDKLNKYEQSFVILRDVDTDRDGLCDFYEKLYGTNPKKADSDKDGFNDAQEINEMGTDPLKKDNLTQNKPESTIDNNRENSSSARFLSEAIKGIRFSDKKSMEDTLAQAYLSLMNFPIGKYGPNKNGVDGVIGYGTNAQIAAFQKAKNIKDLGFNLSEDNLELSIEEISEFRKMTLERLKMACFTGETYTSLGISNASSSSKYLQNDTAKELIRSYLKTYGIRSGSIKNYERLYKSKDVFTRIKKKFKILEKANPEITEIINIGKSVNGQDLLVFKIGNGDKKVFINSEHHPREYVTSVLAFIQIEYLLNSYNKDWIIDGISIKELLKKVSFYFMPVVNPDGLDSCLKGDLGMYTNANGVEINSNYDAFVDPEDDYSKLTGGIPFSQPETKAIKELCEKENFDISIAYHAAGEIIFWNYGQKGESLQNDNNLANVIKNVTGYTLVGAGIRNRDKGFKDWVISRLNKPAFTIEVGKGAITKPLSYNEYETILMQNLKVPLNMGYTLVKRGYN